MWNASTVPIPTEQSECEVRSPAFSYTKTWSGIVVDRQLVGMLLVCEAKKYFESNGVKVLINEHKLTTLQVKVNLNLNLY